MSIKRVFSRIYNLEVFLRRIKSHKLSLLDKASLVRLKSDIYRNKISRYDRTAYMAMLSRAHDTLKMDNLAISQKSPHSKVGDHRDYLSYGRYWWPNPQSDTGLPWIRIDGRLNPESITKDNDKDKLHRFCTSVFDLSLAYYFTREIRFAERALSAMDTWFVSSTTRMNPNLNYAQVNPGEFVPRRVGILDGRIFCERILDSIFILRQSRVFDKKLFDEIESWFVEYLTWLIYSDLGRSASMQLNNHGTWYWFQVASISHFIEDDHNANRAVAEAFKLVLSQIGPDGIQLHEIKRRDPFRYSCFNVTAIIKILTISQKIKYHDINMVGRVLELVRLSIDYIWQSHKKKSYSSLSQNEPLWLKSVVSCANLYSELKNYPSVQECRDYLALSSDVYLFHEDAFDNPYM